MQLFLFKFWGKNNRNLALEYVNRTMAAVWNLCVCAGWGGYYGHQRQPLPGGGCLPDPEETHPWPALLHACDGAVPWCRSLSSLSVSVSVSLMTLTSPTTCTWWSCSMMYVTSSSLSLSLSLSPSLSDC